MIRLLSLFFIFALHCSTSYAQAILPEQVPEALKPWIDWVLYDQKDHPCPFDYNKEKNRHCAWPNKLTLNLNKTQGEFQINWKIYRQSWIQLPGDSEHWPLKVTANGQALIVSQKERHPVVQLRPGDYQIKGQFSWTQLPKILTIPKNTGLLELTIDNKTILNPLIKKHRLWLKAGDQTNKQKTNQQDKLDIQVFRKVIDTVPQQILSRIELDVSGQQREIKLPFALLKDTIPIRLNAPLPARLEADGQLKIQLRPGQWQVELLARYSQPQIKLEPMLNSPNWPKTELWVFEAKPALRVVEIKGLVNIDASQTNLPNRWKQLPAYQLKQGDAMTFKQLQRGDSNPQANQLNLQRKIWLDFDGSGYTVNDKINGSMKQDWRLNSQDDLKLGKVTLQGRDQLITQYQGQQGIEIRQGRLNLSADSRIEADISQFNVTGWQQSFQQVNAELNIPPGWRLLAVSGVDNQPQSWLFRWTLLDLFLLLIAALAISRLWHPIWGIFSLITLALIWHEPGAPRHIWLVLLACIALIRVLPKGKILTTITYLRHGCFLLLILIMIPFMVNQVRIGLYPQLERSWQKITPSTPVTQAMRTQENVQQDSLMEMAAPAKPQSLAKKRVRTTIEQKAEYKRINSQAKVQTGPGLPQWQWHKVNLRWNGSVDSGQQIQLWYLSPMMTMLLNFIRVALISLLALLMFGALKKTFKLNINAFSWLVLIPLTLMPVDKAFAQFPDQAMLEELKNRLLEQPQCLPTCAQISSMKLSVNDKIVTIQLEIHSQQNIALPLPADYQQWFPSKVNVNQQPTTNLLRKNKHLWIGLNKGVHQIELTGATPLLDQFSLPLPLKPKQLTINVNNWQVTGAYNDGRIDKQLQIKRMQRLIKTTQQKQLQPGVLPAFVRLERKLYLGLDWYIVNKVTRLSPSGSSIALNIPLLPGESVTTPGIYQTDNKVAINLSAQQKKLQWRSKLKKMPQIILQADSNPSWHEVWQLDLSSIWHLKSSGLAMMHLNHQGQWQPEWHPWGGEQITLNITRPEAVQGQTMTIESSRLNIKPGQRNQTARLEFKLKSSLGGQHNIQLPEQAQIQSLQINGRSQPIQTKGRELTLPIQPGLQTISVSWLSPDAIQTISQTPQVNLGLNSVNTHLQLDLGQNRWLLLTMGPSFGPAVLFWGMLIVIVLLSIGLGKLTLTPLKHWHWFLLLIGLSQIPLQFAVIVVAWLILLGYRAKHKASKQFYFNLFQILIVLLTIASLLILFTAVEQGLLGNPQMQIVGNHSNPYHLHWYQDRSPATLPTASAISVPIFVYRLLMLAWALWLASALLNWLKWGWQCFVNQGIWQSSSQLVMKSEGKETKL